MVREGKDANKRENMDCASSKFEPCDKYHKKIGWSNWGVKGNYEGREVWKRDVRGI